MKYICLFLLLTLSVIGCSRDNNPLPPAVDVPTGKVDVIGNIKNDNLAWQNYIPNFFKKAMAVTFISTRSSFNDITDPERLADISLSTGIKITAEIVNTLSTKIVDYRVEIAIEDETQITRERWICFLCYPTTGGQSCEGVFEVVGNTFFESNPAPELPVCPGNFGNAVTCVSFFGNGVDCLSPSWKIDYQPPGDGLQRYSIPGITVEALSTFTSFASTRVSSWVPGVDKFARFTVFDNLDALVVQKDYVFNLVK